MSKTHKTQSRTISGKCPIDFDQQKRDINVMANAALVACGLGILGAIAAMVAIANTCNL